MDKLSKVITIALIFSAMIFTGCEKKAPNTPSIPAGPTRGSIDTVYTFTSSAKDPDEDSLAIRFMWSDGDTSRWSDWQASGDSVSMSHSWSDSGTYNIKAQAKDKKDTTSNWSAGHQIEISKEILTGWTFGGQASDVGRSVYQTKDGGYIITGYTKSYGAGEQVYLIKTNENGDTSWTKTFGGNADDGGWSGQQTKDGGYIITGQTRAAGAVGNYDVYLIKTDANGRLQWTRTFGSRGNDYGYSVHPTSDGGYIITGAARAAGAADNYDVYLIKTDANGNQQWYTTFGGSGEDRALSVQQTLDGGYIITGYTQSYGAGDQVYLIKTDANGNQQWYKTFGGDNWDIGYSVQQTRDGGYIIVGSTQSYGAGSDDVYLIKTDAKGDTSTQLKVPPFRWTKIFGGSALDGGYSVQQTKDGGYIIIGGTQSYGAGSDDVWLIKTDEKGNVK